MMTTAALAAKERIPTNGTLHAQVNALTCSTADFKVGLSLEIDSNPWRITGACERRRIRRARFIHIPGRGRRLVAEMAEMRGDE